MSSDDIDSFLSFFEDNLLPAPGTLPSRTSFRHYPPSLTPL